MGLNISAPLSANMSGNEKLHRFRYHLGRAFVTPSDTVADLGCGQAYGSEILSQVARKVIGIDMDEGAISGNREKYPNIIFIHDNLETMDLPDIDVSVSFEVIEHTYVPAKFVENIKKHTKKFIIVSVPFGCEKLVEKDGDIQADLDSTHHSVFDRPEDLDKLFIDDKWQQFYGFTQGVTYISVYYNTENL